MKRLVFKVFACVGFLLLTFTACKENDPSLGVSIRPRQDIIEVGADTFHIVTEENYFSPISAQADTMLLGEFYSKTFGTTKAELLVQLAPPVDYVFPDESFNPTPDSLVMLMAYNTWFGASNAPLEISIYELTKATPDYNEKYYADFDPNIFTDLTDENLLGKRLVTSVDFTVSDSIRGTAGYLPTIRYKFSDEQMERFFNMPKSVYESIDAFCDEFKGMYITTRYGSSTVFNVHHFEMQLYYHYTYKKNGVDTVVNTTILFPANKEVRQLNRITHPDLRSVVKENDTVCHIKSGGGMYPKLKLPIGRMRERINGNIGEKELNLNAADIVVELANVEQYDLDLIQPSYMLAITEDYYEEFMNNYTIPQKTDSTAILVTVGLDGTYKFDISYLLTKHLRADRYNYDDELTVYLIPVEVTLVTTANSSTASVSRIRPRTKLAGAVLRSGRNERSPMRVQILYNGF
jgi:hypothetical protein